MDLETIDFICYSVWVTAAVLCFVIAVAIYLYSEKPDSDFCVTLTVAGFFAPIALMFIVLVAVGIASILIVSTVLGKLRKKIQSLKTERKENNKHQGE